MTTASSSAQNTGRNTGRNTGDLLAGFAVLAVAAAFLAFGLANTGRHAISGLRLSAEFDNVGSLAAGADVRIAGVPVGRVVRTAYDPQTFRARVDFTVAGMVKLPEDSSAQIASAGLLANASLDLAPGGSETMLQSGQRIRITQSAANLEDLLGKFIFNVGNLADAAQKQLQTAPEPKAPGPKAP